MGPGFDKQDGLNISQYSGAVVGGLMSVDLYCISVVGSLAENSLGSFKNRTEAQADAELKFTRDDNEMIPSKREKRRLEVVLPKTTL